MPTIRSLRDIITDLGLSTGLKVCLDAGDASSYSGSGDTITDRSGNGNDFKRGTAAGSDSADPTFNGSGGGLTASEYFSFDGGDNLTIVGSNPLQAFHKAGAKLTILCGVYPVINGSGTNILLGDNVFSTQLGFRVQIQPTGPLAWAAGNGTTQTNIKIGTVLTAANSAWAVTGMSLDASVGANGAFFFLNGAVELFTSTYTSPSASNASGVLCVSGSEGATTANRLVAGSRLAWIAVWDGVALSQAQMNAIYNEAGLRLGLTVGGISAINGDGSLTASGTAQAFGSAVLSGSGALSASGSSPDESETAIPEPIRAIAVTPIAAREEPTAPEDDDLLRLNDSAVIDLVYLLELRPFAPAGTSLPV
jgi:hypothetical protein